MSLQYKNGRFINFKVGEYYEISKKMGNDSENAVIRCTKVENRNTFCNFVIIYPGNTSSLHPIVGTNVRWRTDWYYYSLFTDFEKRPEYFL